MEFPGGQYRFQARYNGLDTTSRDVTLEGSGTNEINFPFKYGSVSIESIPSGAAVIANGMPIGRTPLKSPWCDPVNILFRLPIQNTKMQLSQVPWNRVGN